MIMLFIYIDFARPQRWKFVKYLSKNKPTREVHTKNQIAFAFSMNIFDPIRSNFFSGVYFGDG